MSGYINLITCYGCMFAITGTLFSNGGHVWGSLLWSIISSASGEYLLLYVYLKRAQFFFLLCTLRYIVTI